MILEAHAGRGSVFLHRFVCLDVRRWAARSRNRPPCAGGSITCIFDIAFCARQVYLNMYMLYIFLMPAGESAPVNDKPERLALWARAR